MMEDLFDFLTVVAILVFVYFMCKGVKQIVEIVSENEKYDYTIKTMEVGGDIYENVEVRSRRDLIKAIERSKIIAIRERGKKIYINGNYVVSFQEN